MSEPPANEPPDHWKHINVRGGDVPVENSPVPAGPATVPMGVRAYPGPDRLVLRCPYWIIAPFLGMMGVAALVLVFVWGLNLFPVTPLVFALGFALLVIVGLFLRQTVLPRVTFDRETGLMTMGWNGWRGRRPLSSIIGVQVMQTRKQMGGAELNIPAMTLYQINLILDDPEERRLNVATCDPYSARATARAIADFVGVPVLDSAAPVGGASAAGGDVPPMIPPTVVTLLSPVLAEAGPDVLVLRQSRLAFLKGMRVIGLMSMIALLLSLTAAGAGDDWFLFAAMWVLALLVPVSMLFLGRGRQVRFDRALGELTAPRSPFLRSPLPLASVKAVEVVNDHDYRLDLLLDNADYPRLSLINDANPAPVRLAAERLASFLGVPLQDPGRPAPIAGQPFNPVEQLSRSPVPAGKATIRGPARLLPKGDDRLVLRPRSPVKWYQLVSALVPFGAWLYVAWLLWFGPAAGQAGGGGPSLGWVAILLLQPMFLYSALKSWLLYRDEFDRQAGLLTLGWFGLKGTHPLAQVLAIQLIPGGLVDRPTGPFGRSGEQVSYQLNLVIADAYEDRINLTDDSDLQWTRQAGQQVAEFLGVPLIDQIADGE
jgi:hypothetical protein